MECHNCGQEGHVARQCTWEAALAPKPLKAHQWRCPACRKIIYRWDKDLSCTDHRVIADWQAYYGSGKFVADSAAAREQAERARDKRGDVRERLAGIMDTLRTR